jgi:hypothetical protein
LLKTAKNLYEILETGNMNMGCKYISILKWKITGNRKPIIWGEVILTDIPTPMRFAA